MFIHHLFLDALHTTSQTVSRQEETVTAIVTRPLQNDSDVSVHGQQSGRPGRRFRARVGHLRSLRHQLFVNDQGNSKGHSSHCTLRPLLPFLYKPHPPRPTLRKLAATSICHDPPRLIVHSMGPSFYISTLLLLLLVRVTSFFLFLFGKRFISSYC
jgi:hypothetical protein